MANPDPYVRPSRISIPPHAHPLARLVFYLMKTTGMTYDETEHRSGVLRQTLKSYRCEKIPSLRSAEALLGVWGWRLLPCPPIANLPAEVMEQLEEVGQHFINDDQTLAAAIFAATSKPAKRSADDGPAPRMTYRERYWQEATA